MSAECAHTLDSGKKCQAPARNGSTFCHHHAPRIHLDPNPRERRESEPISLPPLEGKGNILVAINEVIDALAERRIKCAEARILLIGLKFADRLVTELEAQRRSFSGSRERPASEDAPSQSAQPAAAQPRKPSAEELDQFVHSLQQAAQQQLLRQAKAKETPWPNPLHRAPVSSPQPQTIAASADS